MISDPAVVVTDTSIWIDLKKCGLIRIFFELPYLICTSDFIKEYESAGVIWEDLERQGLQFIGLGGDESVELYNLKKIYSGPSLPDIASYLVARKLNGILLTGDKSLRNLAGKALEVHGFLWVMNQMVIGKRLPPILAIEKLEQIMQDDEFFVPRDLCMDQIRIWRKII